MPSFRALAQRHAPLRAHVADGHIDFGDADAVRALTAAMLADLGVRADVPRGRLCPTIPNRQSYIEWIAALVDAPHARGLDVGTGSIGVYCALACALHPGWKMVGTDTDPAALDGARAMLAATAAAGDPRGITARIAVRAGGADLIPRESFDFCVCNPPFYADAAERAQCAALKTTPHAHAPAADAEMYTPGGEVAFVSRLIAESRHRDVAWPSAMLGRLSSVGALVRRLRRDGTTNYALAELAHGHTRRWALAWSHGGRRLPDRLARPRSRALARWLPPSNERTLGAPMPSAAAVHAWLASEPTLPRECAALAARADGVEVCIFDKCWMRGARRRRARARAEAAEAAPPHAPAAPLLAVHITPGMQCTWTFGYERVLFDSLSAHLATRRRAREPPAQSACPSACPARGGPRRHS